MNAFFGQPFLQFPVLLVEKDVCHWKSDLLRDLGEEVDLLPIVWIVFAGGPG
jgi:hypothetical protein